MTTYRDSALIATGQRHAAALSAAHGRTYHLASRLLPTERRRAVHALYGFARLVDDLVDTGALEPAAAALGIDDAEQQLHLALVGAPLTQPPTDLSGVVAALAAATHRFAIPTDTFDAFLNSMRMDVPGTPQHRNRFDTLAELAEYTYGSAGVIGLQLLSILGLPDAEPDVRRRACALGEAFQLTNFLRDVAEDLDRDRIYLPLAELAPFGVDEQRLRRCHTQRRTDAPLRRALAHLIAINRDIYRTAWPGISALPRASRPAIAAAARSYSDILAAIEESGYAVMSQRAVVPTRRRVRHAAGAMVGEILGTL